MDTGFKNAFEYKVIYAFTIEDELHKGLVKIGDATLHTSTPVDQLTPGCRELNQASLKRIKSYTNTAGITPKILHSEVAIRTIHDKDGSIKMKAFRDHHVHEVLKNSGIQNVQLGESTGKEWFPIDLETAKKAIAAVKNNYANLSNSDIVKNSPIIFRPEQAACIAKVVKHFKKADRFLINAKMRYGKTLVSLEIVKRCKFKKTIILTHRPVVDAGWYEDFTKIFYGMKDIVYGSKSTGYTVEQLIDSGKKFIYFASIQDLRGSAEVGGKFNKNDIIFKTEWDCVIVDEAHEGTTTALGEDTVNAVVKEGSGTKLLALSGTPFNILTEYDENSIYTWDYIMEQEYKTEWDKQHFGDHNPYDELPELRIYTYSLGDILKNKDYITFEDKAFNFHEFFRVFTGDYSKDYVNMPKGSNVGDFVHEDDVWSFLNLMATENEQNQYPYSNEKYRALFKHTLWMVPGVKEARALKKLMLKHRVFGNGMFNIVNVAGSGDEEEKSEEALQKVRSAINDAKKDDTYTITLSCGKLTTGVTVKEWTAVFMLAGSYSTSAANYLQTIFRVQSPCNEDGKIKETAYVFDFAPDRTLKMVSGAVQISANAGKTKIGDKQLMGKFLNYCPVISVSGSEMREYSATKLLQQLKRAYAEKVVRNGFDDTNLYNDELFKLDSLEVEKFNDLKGIIGKSKINPKAKDIIVNEQGLTQEEYEEKEKLEKKKKKELTQEERLRLEELKKKKKIRNDAISILRGISIRMPLLIYGADIPYDEEITLSRFVDVVDNSSWDEFMPTGVTKKKFKEFQKYYDEEVFIAAGRRIRNIAKEADYLDPTERVKKIAGLFSYFKNPDKETVLTPWRVVNMHMSDCLGGYCFYDESFKEEGKLDKPRFVDKGHVTEAVFGKLDAQILEINSKTGLYPLYVTYNIYRRRLKEVTNKQLSIKEKNELWINAVDKNIFIICKTPMAKTITKRTLTGFSYQKINAHYFDDLINVMKNKPNQFISKVNKQAYWKKGNQNMKFDAIIGNPPYQLQYRDGSGCATPLYNHFVDVAKNVNAKYISMIMPARWYTGGKGLNSFRKDMLSDDSITTLVDYGNSQDVFSGVDIAGGLCYFLRDKDYHGDCNVINRNGLETIIDRRSLGEFEIFVRDSRAVNIIHKVSAQTNKMMNETVSARVPFGISTNYKPKKEGIPCWFIQKIGLKYADLKDITDVNGILNKWKFLAPKTPIAGQTDFTKPVGFYYDGNTKIAEPGTCCTDSYVVLHSFDTEEEAKSFKSYLFTKITRFLLLQCVASQDVNREKFKFVPDLIHYEGIYTDERLRKMWGINDEEWKLIDSRICNIKGKK